MNQSQSAKKKKSGLQGRWTKSQKQRFVSGFQKFGRNWAEVAKIVKTRTLSQVRSHAQKFLPKMEQHGLDPGSEFQCSDQIPYEESSLKGQHNFRRRAQKKSMNIIQCQQQEKSQQIQENQNQADKFNDKIESVETKQNQVRRKLPIQTFISEGQLMNYIFRDDHQSQFMNRLLLNWRHFDNGGNFLQLMKLGKRH